MGSNITNDKGGVLNGKIYIQRKHGKKANK